MALPFGRAEGSNQDWRYVNNNGHLILQRALEWGAGNDVVATGFNVLLVVANPSSLDSQETAKKTLIESWGHTVNLIDESDSQTNFDIAIAANDVAYVPQEIDTANLGTKLTSASIGVVNEDGQLVDELGISQDKLFKERMEIDVLDNSHYITQPFTTGLLNFVSSNQPVHMLSGTIAPGLTALAQSFNTGSNWNPSLGVISAGGELYGGTSAAGRRVQLPWAGTAFDINALTDDGRSIMERAIEWGAGNGCGSMQPLLLVVSDVGTPSSQETARQTLIGSWCYNVTLIDDDAAFGEFATGMALNDVIYISQEITTLSVATKLKGASIGIVNEEYLMSSGLGFGSGTGTGFFNDINIVDNTHYITSGFGSGALALFDPSYDLYTGTGFTLAPDLEVLGETGSITGLMALESGGALWDAGNAAGRRVQVPWGDDFSALNADGQTLMQRAIEWAAGAGTGPIAHWKLDETTGIIAVDSEGGHDGDLTGGAWTTGTIDGGLELNGSSAYVSALDDDNLDLVDAFTLMGWINNDTLSGYDLVFNKGDASNDQNYWLGTNGSEIAFGFYNGAYREFNTSGASLNTGTWYHIAATFDNATDELRLYLNGAEVLSDTTTYTPLANTGKLYIGRSQYGEYWDGTLDELRIYGSVLSTTEIAGIAAWGGGGGPPPGCAATIADDFETDDYTGSTGDPLWNANWTEVNENGNANTGDEQIVVQDGGNYVARVRDNDSGGEGILRSADLSGHTTALLSFDYWRGALDNATDDFVNVQVWPNASSEWETVLVIAPPPGTDATGSPQSGSHDISTFITNDTHIRFVTSPNMGNNDSVYLDNIKIELDCP